MLYNFVSLLFALGGLVFAAWLYRDLFRQPAENLPMQNIALAIKEGAQAFVRRQYKTIGYLAVIVMASIYIIYALSGDWRYGLQTAFAFILGAVFSSLAGIIGMYLSVRLNLLTAETAQNSFAKALHVALRGGAISGMTVVSLSLLGLSGLFWFYNSVLGFEQSTIPGAIVGFGFGASFVALFAQLGGGIFTKAADMGADLVGKVEAGIPEDDPRNPAVIADLVGDNVGDCAGRGADLFESTAAENIGAMILGVSLYPAFGIKGIMFPLLVRAFGLLASALGILSVKAKEDEKPMQALNRGYYVTCLFALLLLAVAVKWLLAGNWWFLAAGAVGLVMSIYFVFITQYYTEYHYRPVKSIATASETGPATNIVAGLSVGMESTALPVIGIVVALLASYKFGVWSGVANGGLYGTAVATMGMLATCAYILAMDNFGPIVDNAGGIAEMSGADQSTRERTDKLDAAGNTTKALTKGYAMGSAALAAFLLFSAYLTEAGLKTVDLAKIEVFLGGLLGAMLVFLFSGWTIRAVGKAAYYIINEARRQFKETPGILTGSARPDYSLAVDLATRGALREMVAPGLLVVIVPIVVGWCLRAEAAAALLMVGTIAGIILALMMNNAGGAWDNAKKFVEAGLFKDAQGQVQGKKTAVHAAAVVGDTVGDPFKDAAGPSLHVLVKLLSTLTLVLAALFI